MKLKLSFQKKPEREVGPGTKAKAKLELLHERLFEQSPESLREELETDEGRKVVLADAEQTHELIKTTLGLGGLAERYRLSPRNWKAYNRVSIMLKDALMEDPEMEDEWTRSCYELRQKLEENFKGRSVYPEQYKVEVVEQEPHVVYVPTGPNWKRPPDNQRLD